MADADARFINYPQFATQVLSAKHWNDTIEERHDAARVLLPRFEYEYPGGLAWGIMAHVPKTSIHCDQHSLFRSANRGDFMIGAAAKRLISHSACVVAGLIEQCRRFTWKVLIDFEFHKTPDGNATT